MAEGIVSLRKTQFGREATAGTAVAATSVQRLMTNGAKDDSVVEFVNEHIGYLAPVNRTTLPKKAASIAFDDSPMTSSNASIRLTRVSRRSRLSLTARELERFIPTLSRPPHRTQSRLTPSRAAIISRLARWSIHSVKALRSHSRLAKL
ncbi:hypothetical protein [Candidatus Villigracilis saccharophilus]|uniref:hypothetical protein n=1 Tax=Candidatus Villigracilis saccharophilus TaxID=3140684 RepID=UPI003134CEDD|nr:hypothetical protein [Anaerolineales bacterium]